MLTIFAECVLKMLVCKLQLDYSVTWQKVKDVFKVAGKVISVDLAKDRDGKSKGHALVQFSEPAEAINAIGMLSLRRSKCVFIEDLFPWLYNCI